MSTEKDAPIDMGPLIQEADDIINGRTMKLATNEHLRMLVYWRRDMITYLKGLEKDLTHATIILNSSTFEGMFDETVDRLKAKRNEIRQQIKFEEKINGA